VGAAPTCADIDECATDNGGCGSATFFTCANNVGAAPTCADIDECATMNGGCAQTCTNSVGGFACSCGSGYTLNADGRSCDDVNECLTDNGGCDVNATCSNTDGSRTCTCVVGYVGDGFTCTFVPPTSCAQVLARTPAATSGVYTLQGRTGTYQAYCDMTTAGGGWTLVLKADGRLTNFSYDNARWTGSTTFNPANAAFDRNEALLESYFSVPFTQVRVGMEDPIPGTVRYVTVPHAASSLSSVIAPGARVTTSIGRAAWRGLMASPSLQPNCNREGFNVQADAPAAVWARARIGIISNQEGDCGSPDSRIGIGTAGDACGQDTTISVGNAAFCSADAGDRNTRGFGYVFVR
jgi:hypothetical protein